MCCPLDCDPNLKPGDPLPCWECRDDYRELAEERRAAEEEDLVWALTLTVVFSAISGFLTAWAIFSMGG